MLAEHTEFDEVLPEVGPVELVSQYEAYADRDELLGALNEIYTDSDELVGVLGRVGASLPGEGLDHLLAFNTAYLSLSGDVRDAVKRSYEEDDGRPRFSHPEVVERTMGIFAELYFRQIRAHVQGTPELVDEAWRPLFYSDAGKNASPGIQFLLGMNAHIVYDLPQALSKSGVDDDYYADYTAVVGLIIDKVAEGLALAYVPGTDGMRKFLVGQTTTRIATWRDDAWDAGKQLQATMGRHEKREGHFIFDVPRGRIATKGIMRECKRNALRNARNVKHLGRAGLSIVSLAGRPPMDVADLPLPPSQSHLARAA